MALSKKEIARRRPFGLARARVRFLIRHELRLSGHSCVSFAETIGCTVSNVSRVLNGKGHSETVLNGLRDIGVPEKYLFDPHRNPATEP